MALTFCDARMSPGPTRSVRVTPPSRAFTSRRSGLMTEAARRRWSPALAMAVLVAVIPISSSASRASEQAAGTAETAGPRALRCDTEKTARKMGPLWIKDVRGLAFPGVNLAAADFADEKMPGVLHRDYTYPSNEVIDYYARKGFRLIRLPFKWGRIQRKLFAALHAPDMTEIDRIVDRAASHGMTVALDLHDYGFYGPRQKIGSEVPTAAFGNVWRRIAERYKGRNVFYGIMNEPHDHKPREWLVIANAAIAAIRSVGARELVLVPGTAWTGAHSWISSGNGAVMAKVADPIGNVAIEVHQYLDSDSSGTNHGEHIPGAGAERLIAFTEWARENRLRGFLGEFGWSDMPEGHREGRALLRYLYDNQDVWMGYAYWAGGPWWGEYPYSIEPDKAGQDRSQMKILEEFLQLSEAGCLR
jgi:endoglucanase